MKHVLITGAAGFIGYFLAKSLVSDGVRVDLLDNFSRAVQDSCLNALLENKNARLIKADLLSEDGLENLSESYDYVFHFAAIIGVEHVLKRPYHVLLDNMRMLSAMLDFSRGLRNLQRFVFLSTSEVYAGTLQKFGMKVPTPEETPLTLTDLERPRTSYMLSKISGEALCQYSALPFTIFRPHNIYGPRMGRAHVIPQLLEKLYHLESNRDLEVFSPNHTRTFCYVSDAINMLKLTVLSSVSENEVYNLGVEHPEISIKHLAEMVIGVVGKQAGIQPMPNTAGSPMRRCPDMKKLNSIINYEPKTELEAGIQACYEWYSTQVFNHKEQCAQ